SGLRNTRSSPRASASQGIRGVRTATPRSRSAASRTSSRLTSGATVVFGVAIGSQRWRRDAAQGRVRPAVATCVWFVRNLVNRTPDQDRPTRLSLPDQAAPPQAVKRNRCKSYTIHAALRSLQRHASGDAQWRLTMTARDHAAPPPCTSTLHL